MTKIGGKCDQKNEKRKEVEKDLEGRIKPKKIEEQTLNFLSQFF